MDALHRNDRPGEYPPSWYAATSDLPPPRPPLDGDTTADVCVVGAGYTGLSAALELATRGLSVVVIDAHRAGFGASGRNGGQVGSGYNRSQSWLERRVGDNAARALWDMTEAAKALLRERVATLAPEARYAAGVVHGAYTGAEARDLAQEAAHLSRRYDYDEIEVLDTGAMQALVRTERYVGGVLDRGAGHIHPLRYALGLARAAEAAGARIHDLSEATGIDAGPPAVVTTPRGRITAGHVILAGNGYLPGLMPGVAARVMPINSFIAATAPLSDRRAVLAEDVAVADSKFVVNYFRMAEDGRFLFGGRENYGIGFPRDIEGALVRRMVALFPQLAGVPVDHAWGGSLGITMSRLPLVCRPAPNVLNASGFSGHGVALSGFAGTVMAEAVAGEVERFDLLSTLPVPAFPGGTALRAPLLTLAMTWYALRDRLGI